MLEPQASKTFVSIGIIIGSFGTNAKEPMQSWIIHPVTFAASSSTQATSLIIETSVYAHELLGYFYKWQPFIFLFLIAMVDHGTFIFHTDVHWY